MRNAVLSWAGALPATVWFVACASGEPAVGPSGFAEAIDLGGTEPAAETYEDADLLHLQYVLDAKASSAYPKLSAAERQEILRLVWASLDPTPTTERNERKLAHYQRLAYAREHFAIPQDPGWARRGELEIESTLPATTRVWPSWISRTRWRRRSWGRWIHREPRLGSPYRTPHTSALRIGTADFASWMGSPSTRRLRRDGASGDRPRGRVLSGRCPGCPLGWTGPCREPSGPGSLLRPVGVR